MRTTYLTWGNLKNKIERVQATDLSYMCKIKKELKTVQFHETIATGRAENDHTTFVHKSKEPMFQQ